jgi:signal transduction histidine kinase
LSRKVQELEGELTTARRRETAIAEILQAISHSPKETQPVLDAVAKSAAHLCEAEAAGIFRRAENRMLLVAHYGPMPFGFGPVGEFSFPLIRGSVNGRSMLDARTIHLADLMSESSEYPEGSENARRYGHRTVLAVPLLREGVAIGSISLHRGEAQLFTETQVALLQTFAVQAVIAIENTRLFEAEQASKRELEESLEYQTATSEVLNVISRSPPELKPVLDAIVATAIKLCEGFDAHILLKEGDRLRVGAHHGGIALSVESMPIGRGWATGRAVIDCAAVHVLDFALMREEFPEGHQQSVRDGARTGLAVPLLRDGDAIGSFMIRRKEVRPFSDKQIKLLETFADQAVIAIENTRLFEAEQTRTAELQARTRELTESLEQQTATADVLKVISRSALDVQKVLDALVESAARLCDAYDAAILQVFGDGLRLVAHHGQVPTPGPVGQGTIPLVRGLITGRAVLERRTIQVADILAEADEYPESRKYALQLGFRTAIAVPLVHAGKAIGVIFIRRAEVRPFTGRQIELVGTFADQAVIAIENTRLLEELQARNRDLTALGEVGRAVGSTLDLKLVLKTIVERAVELSGTDGGSIFYYREEPGRFELGETTGLDDEVISTFRKLDITAGQTGLGETIAKRQPLQVPDILRRASNPLRDAAIDAGFRAALIVPLLSAEAPLGALVLQRRQPGEFTQAIVSLMQSFADQSAIALENARLFNEIAQKGRELEIASQHKSQFVANMSHELRTPLAAILGYAELMQEGFYEPQGPKSLDALTRIRANGKHLLGLINSVLDIAKIESGQFSLNLSEYALDSVVETVRSATEALAQTKKLVLNTDVAASLPIGLGDEQRLTQVLLNLVGNAIKFTDRGEVRVTAKAVNGHFTVSVKDTGPGIPEAEQKRIFEQFHQVDNSLTKAKGGTGLGLAIAKQIVEMHGGRMWVESTLGKGSTFRMELPVRATGRAGAP